MGRGALRNTSARAPTSITSSYLVTAQNGSYCSLTTRGTGSSRRNAAKVARSARSSVYAWGVTKTCSGCSTVIPMGDEPRTPVLRRR